jgi:hypothetical protein
LKKVSGSNIANHFLGVRSYECSEHAQKRTREKVAGKKDCQMVAGGAAVAVGGRIFGRSGGRVLGGI